MNKDHIIQGRILMCVFLALTAVTWLGCSSRSNTRFTRLSPSSTGIDFNNEIIEDDSFNIMRNEYMYNGGGVGIADLNQDGLQDLVFTGNKVMSRIFLNKGGMKFEDISDAFEGMNNAQWISGVAVVDINADGLQDLYFTSTMNRDSSLRKNQLWVNQGVRDGKPGFKEMAEQYGITVRGHSMHAAFLDYDLDGDLDLYVLDNIVSKEIPTNYRAKINDGTSINNDHFFENLGDGHFQNVTVKAGIVHEGYGLGIAVGDINHDKYPDLYISNDYISNDILYLNKGDGTFENRTGDYISYQSQFSMGNDLADINNDGYQDIITLDMFPEEYARKKQTINGNSYIKYKYNQDYGYQAQYVRNMLHVHNGVREGELLPFSEVGQLAGVYQTEWSWSALFADYDNDGDRDLMITNGFPKDLTDKDFTNYKAQMYGYLVGDKDIIPRIPVVKVSNYAYENTGELTFANRTKEWGMEIPSFSNGAAFVDLDNDGDLDYVTNNINDIAFVYQNNSIEKEKTKNNFLRIELQGNGQNTMAIGAKVELWSGGKYQYYEHHLSRGYLSSVDPVIHFGLGENPVVDSLKVIWPVGKSHTVVRNVNANQLLELKEAESQPLNQPGSVQVNTLFVKTDGIIPYAHLQDDYNDFFQSQRIIQHKFSQVGPCMTKGDLNGDGVEDLLIAGSEKQPSTVYLKTVNGFEEAMLPGLSGIRLCQEADLAIGDFDKDGDNDVVALSGGYAMEQPDNYLHNIYIQDQGAFTGSQLPLPAFPASVVRPADFDKDGDLDIFVGARVERMNFPHAPKSYLLVNSGKGFNEQDIQPLDLGMVTDAVWSDADGDGWQDLLVAREWNSLALLKNANGKSLTPTDEFTSKRGFWSCIISADLDRDGDDDYIAGNLGDNHRFTITEETPMKLYAYDIDKNGVIDPVTVSYWKDKDGIMKEFPVNYLDELAAQSPFFRKKFQSYTQFSHTPMDSILDLKSIPDSVIMTVNTSSSYVIWNEDDGFKWELLPRVAQVSPVKKILVDDFNGDLVPDLLLAGNDHSYDVSTGYYDANKGCVLLGDKERTFTVVPPAKSGFVLNGQVESLLRFEGDTSLIVAGINRREAVVYRINENKNEN